MRRRSETQELIDLGPSHYTEAEYKDCLRQLGRIGRLLGGDRATLRGVDQVCKDPRSILDVGCGGGDLARVLARKYPQSQVLGIDISEEAIAYATQVQNNPPNLRFEKRADKEFIAVEKSFDVVVSSLVCHHMPEDELVDFLNRACKIAKKGVVVNDLHRHWGSWIGFALLAPLFFKNRLILHDGLLSIRRGFKKKEWIAYFDRAGVHHYEIQWKWAFRWVVTAMPI